MFDNLSLHLVVLKIVFERDHTMYEYIFLCVYKFCDKWIFI